MTAGELGRCVFFHFKTGNLLKFNVKKPMRVAFGTLSVIKIKKRRISGTSQGILNSPQQRGQRFLRQESIPR
jgi:hypothetical protein